MKQYDCQQLLEVGDDIWDRQCNFENKYVGNVWFDGGFFFSLPHYALADKKYLKDLLKLVEEKRHLLKEAYKEFGRIVRTDGDEWKSHFSEDLASLSKEEITRQFLTEYETIRSDYELLRYRIKSLKEKKEKAGYCPGSDKKADKIFEKHVRKLWEIQHGDKVQRYLAKQKKDRKNDKGYAYFCGGPTPTKERDLEAEIRQNWEMQKAKEEQNTK